MTVPVLQSLRQYHSANLPHNKDLVNRTGKKRIRPTCALCSTTIPYQRKTEYGCSTCMIPLCVKLLPGQHKNEKTCFEIFHTTNDLLTAS